MGFRLGLDIGTNSIGWVLLKVKQDNQTVDTPNPKVIEKTGIRIFSDGREPKTYSTKNAQRREHRLAARRRDRFLQRQKYLISFLKDVGLMPQNEKDRKQLQNLDPWELRAKARSEKLSDFELGRIFLHINQRRGFKSNRKSLNKNEDGVVKQSVKEFKEKSGDKTIGEYLYTFHKDRKPIRARRKGSGKKDTYSFYYNRGMLIDEFSKICEKQRSFGNEILSEENQNKLHDIIFFQRPLKRPIVGRCSIFPDKERAPRSLIAFQKFRLLQDINQLEIYNDGEVKALSPESRKKLFDWIFKSSSKTIEKIKKEVQKLEKLEGTINCNYDSKGSKKSFKGNETAKAFKEIQTKLSEDNKGELILKLDAGNPKNNHLYLSDDDLKNWLVEKSYSPSDIEYILGGDFELHLPSDHSSFSKKAIDMLIPHLEEGLLINEAIDKIRPEAKNSSGVYNSLPKYQEILDDYVSVIRHGSPEARISNPTVHAALNQLRLVVNDIISRYGKPEQMVIELARDLPMGQKSKNEHTSKQEKNRKENERVNTELEKLGQKLNYQNRTRYKLWEEQSNKCIYSGKNISVTELFSNKIEVDHILPFSRTLDDGFLNKVVCFKEANQDKTNKTPFEAYSSTKEKYNQVLDRAKDLPLNKSWRFNKNAMDRFKDKEKLLARHLNDTRYISRLAKMYMECLYEKSSREKGITQKIWVVTGRMTSNLRHHWGLNTILSEDNIKDRGDHRHHAIDAFVVALTERSMIMKINTELAKQYSDHEGSVEDLTKQYPKPWNNLREDLEKSINKIIVSHKPTRFYEGQIHEETAYGVKGERDQKGNYTVYRRVAPEDIKKAKDIKEIVDEYLTAEFRHHKEQGTIEEFKQKHNVKKLKVKEVKQVFTVGKEKHTGFVGGNNWAFDIYEKPDGSWNKYVISSFEIHQHMTRKPKDKSKKEWLEKYRPDNCKSKDYKLIARLHAGDLVNIEGRIGKVQKFRYSGGQSFFVSDHFSSNPKDADKKGNQYGSMKKLKEQNFRKINISPAGFYCAENLQHTKSMKVA